MRVPAFAPCVCTTWALGVGRWALGVGRWAWRAHASGSYAAVDFRAGPGGEQVVEGLREQQCRAFLAQNFYNTKAWVN